MKNFATRTRTEEKHILTLKHRLGFQMFFPVKLHNVSIDTRMPCSSKSSTCANLTVVIDIGGEEQHRKYYNFRHSAQIIQQFEIC